MSESVIDHEKLAELMKNGWSYRGDSGGGTVDTVAREQLSQLSLEIADKLTTPETAEVGQTIVVSAVDENGKPTAWKVADMGSGGGEEWELIADVTTEEHVAEINITKDINSNDFRLKKALVIGYMMGDADDGTTAKDLRINFNKDNPLGTWSGKVAMFCSGGGDGRKMSSIYAESIGGYVYTSDIMGSYNVAMGNSVANSGNGANEAWMAEDFINKKDTMKGIDGVNIGSYQIAITSGTRIIVYGIRE